MAVSAPWKNLLCADCVENYSQPVLNYLCRACIFRGQCFQLLQLCGSAFAVAFFLAYLLIYPTDSSEIGLKMTTKLLSTKKIRLNFRQKLHVWYLMFLKLRDFWKKITSLKTNLLPMIFRNFIFSQVFTLSRGSRSK